MKINTPFAVLLAVALSSLSLPAQDFMTGSFENGSFGHSFNKVESSPSNDFEAVSSTDNYAFVQQSPELVDFHLKASQASDISIDKPKHRPAVKNFEIYRNKEKYPVDPRKPCNDCVRPESRGPFTAANVPGLFGRPHMDSGTRRLPVW